MINPEKEVERKGAPKPEWTAPTVRDWEIAEVTHSGDWVQDHQSDLSSGYS